MLHKIKKNNYLNAGLEEKKVHTMHIFSDLCDLPRKQFLPSQLERKNS
jgi:hypothetical protein